jgi:hypothetical protein
MGKRKKHLFVLCNLFISAYVTFVVYVSHSGMLFIDNERTLIVFFSSVILFLFVYNFMVFVCSRYASTAIGITGEKAALKKATALLFGGSCAIILLLSLAASFPGGVSPDTTDQWAQVHNAEFNDWHPIIHALLIWLVTRIIDHYAFVVFIQLTAFSIGVGLLIATPESWGFGRKHLLTAGLFIILNPNTMNILMYPWKDLTLTILLTYTTTMVINIYLSNGLWFTKWRNVFAFALTTGIASVVRHNGFFLPRRF